MIDSKLKQFVEAFELESHGYSAPIFFEGGEFGFSTLKEPEFVVKGMALPDDEPLLTLIHVGIDADVLASSRVRKPLYCRLQFVQKRNGRCFVDETMLKKIRNRPVDLVSTDEYFYDFSSQSFYRGNSPISAHQIFNELYKLHINTAWSWRGLKLHIKLLAWKISASSLEYAAMALAGIHKTIYGEKVEYNPVLQAFREKVGTKTQTDVPRDDTKKLPLFGYDANAQLIVAYCVIHLLAYVLMFFFDWFPLFLKHIFNNNFLTVVYVITSLALMETVLKRVLHKAIIILGSWSFSLSIRNIIL